jgi:hypothetical protein
MVLAPTAQHVYFLPADLPEGRLVRMTLQPRM